PHGLRHDDGRGAGDGNEADLEVLLLERGALGEDVGGGAEWKDLGEGGKRRRGADRFQEGAARSVPGDSRAHDGGGDQLPVALILGQGAQRRGGGVVLDLAAMTAAATAEPTEPAVRGERMGGQAQPPSPGKKWPP